MPELKKCPECAADVLASEAFCWMCHAQLWAPKGAKSPEAERPRTANAGSAPGPSLKNVPASDPGPEYTPLPPRSAQAASRDLGFSEPGLVGLLLMILAGCLSAADPRLSSFGILLLVPALVAVLVGPGPKKRGGPPATWSDRIMTGFRVTGMVIGVVAISMLAISIALLMTCAAVMAATGFHF